MEGVPQIAEMIHETSVALLQDPGIKIDHEEIAGLLVKQGAESGPAAGVVRLPRKMIDEHLALCPKEVVLTDRRGNKKVLTSRKGTSIWSCPGMYLYRNGVHRLFTSADMADCAKLLNHLEHIDGVFGMAMADVIPDARDVIGLKIIAENSSKHIRAFCFSPRGARTMAEMRNVVGDHPWFSMGFTAHGPLRWTQLALDIFKHSSGFGIPVTINGEPMAGVTGPVTLAGSAAVGNAEILAGLVINQILEPGRPCIYNLGLAHTFDMKTSIAVTGGPENALFANLSAVMGRFYNLPSASWVSTESMTPDAQAALEKTCGFLTHLQSGVSNIWGVGQLESELTFSPAQAVIDNEIIGFAKRFLRGIEVNSENLALDVIREVGISGSFIEHPHTFDNFRSEFFMPSLLGRVKREPWQALGGKRLDEKAEESASNLINRQPDNDLTEEQEVELRKITKKFLAQLQG